MYLFSIIVQIETKLEPNWVAKCIKIWPMLCFKLAQLVWIRRIVRSVWFNESNINDPCDKLTRVSTWKNRTKCIYMMWTKKSNLQTPNFTFRWDRFNKLIIDSWKAFFIISFFVFHKLTNRVIGVGLCSAFGASSNVLAQKSKGVWSIFYFTKCIWNDLEK